MAVPIRKIVKRLSMSSLPALYLLEKFGHRRGQRLAQDRVIEGAYGRTYSVNELVRTIHRDGVVCLEKFYSADQISEVAEKVKALNQAVERGDIQKGSELGTPPLQTDALSWADVLRSEGIIRVNHARKLVPEISFFADDPDWRQVGALYLGKRIFNMVTISQYNEPCADGCRDFHIDSHSNQFKAFVYLTDVEEAHGPFMYAMGSHKITWDNMARVRRAFHSKNTSVTEDEVRQTGYPVKSFCAPKGSVILADTRGIHCGKTLTEGHRLALVNYYVLCEDFGR